MSSWSPSNELPRLIENFYSIGVRNSRAQDSHGHWVSTQFITIQINISTKFNWPKSQYYYMAKTIGGRLTKKRKKKSDVRNFGKRPNLKKCRFWRAKWPNDNDSVLAGQTEGLKMWRDVIKFFHVRSLHSLSVFDCRLQWSAVVEVDFGICGTAQLLSHTQWRLNCRYLSRSITPLLYILLRPVGWAWVRVTLKLQSSCILMTVNHKRASERERWVWKECGLALKWQNKSDSQPLSPELGIKARERRERGMGKSFDLHVV